MINCVFFFSLGSDLQVLLLNLLLLDVALIAPRLNERHSAHAQRYPWHLRQMALQKSPDK